MLTTIKEVYRWKFPLNLSIPSLIIVSETTHFVPINSQENTVNKRVKLRSIKDIDLIPGER